MADAPRITRRKPALEVARCVVGGCHHHRTAFSYLIWAFYRDGSSHVCGPGGAFQIRFRPGRGESASPTWVWKVLPKMFGYLPGKKTYNPGREYASLGFLYEPAKISRWCSTSATLRTHPSLFELRDLSRGSLRETPQNSACNLCGHAVEHRPISRVSNVSFLPAQQINRFNAPQMISRMESLAARDFINNSDALYAIPFMRERLLHAQRSFPFADWNRDEAPGRTDTFNPGQNTSRISTGKNSKTSGAGWPLRFSSHLAARTTQQKNLHAAFDGNNSLMEERNKSAAFGTGAFPPTIDR